MYIFRGICIYIYIYIYVCHICIFIYIYKKIYMYILYTYLAALALFLEDPLLGMLAAAAGPSSSAQVIYISS